MLDKYKYAKDIPDLLAVNGNNPLRNKELSVKMPWYLYLRRCKLQGIKPTQVRNVETF
jgi:hypothetical protein